MHKIFIGLWLAAATGTVAAASPTQVLLHVENMTCAACSITIEKALDKVSGVAGEGIDTEAGTVIVTFDAERTNAAAIAQAITAAGFPATVEKTGTNGG